MSTLHRSFRWRLAPARDRGMRPWCWACSAGWSGVICERWPPAASTSRSSASSATTSMAPTATRRSRARSAIPCCCSDPTLQDIALWVQAPTGETLHRDPQWPDGLDPRRSAPHRAGSVSSARTATLQGRAYRIGRLVTERASLAVAVDLAHFHRELLELQLHWVLALGAALLLAFLGSWWHARRALAPVVTLTCSLEDITARDLDRRVPDGGGFAEFQRLTAVCNGLLERLERGFSQAARFSADASHEMRTPLTIMQGQVEAAMQSLPDGSPAQAALATQLDEIGRLKSLVRKLLLLSQADAGRLPLQREPMNRQPRGLVAGRGPADSRPRARGHRGTRARRRG